MAYSTKTEVFIFRTLFKLISPNGSDTKRLVFNIVSNVECTFVNFIVVFLFLYFITTSLVKNTLVNSLIVTLGAISTDLYYFKTLSHNSSYFFSENYKVNVINLTIWFICTVASIKLSYFVRVKRLNKDVQPALRP
jgi:hypothetical protein